MMQFINFNKCAAIFCVLTETFDEKNIKSTFIDMTHSLAPNPDSNLNNPNLNLKTRQNVFLSQNALTFDFVT